MLPRRKLLLALSWFAAVSTARSFSIDNAIVCPPEAVPPGHFLRVTYGETWLPEPIQTKFYKAPAMGAPLKGCLSVVNLEMEPAGATLSQPVTITFACDEAAGRSIPYAFINGQWTALAAGWDDAGRVTITVNDLTTYALIGTPNS